MDRSPTPFDSVNDDDDDDDTLNTIQLLATETWSTTHQKLLNCIMLKYDS